MRWAVHGLQRHPISIARNHRAVVVDIRDFVRDNEHVGAIFAPMSRLLPLPRIHDLRRFHFLITSAVNRAAHIALKFTPDQIAIRMPEYRAMRLLLQMKQVHVLAQTAMVALGSLFQPEKMCVQLLFVQPARAVYPA